MNDTMVNKIFSTLAWLWRPSRVGRVCGTGAIVIAGIVPVTGCGLAVGEEDPPAPPTRMVLMDVSESTSQAQSAYIDDFTTETREFALRQGTLHVIVAAGDPLAQSRMNSVTFSTEEEGDFGNADLIGQANIVVEEVDGLLKDPPVDDRNRTALIRAFVLASREVERTEGPLEIVVYSDGVENSEDINMYRSELDDAAINATLDRLEAEGLMPAALRGVPIRFVLPGYDPGGSDVDLVRAEHFWRSWAERVGAKLTWG